MNITQAHHNDLPQIIDLLKLSIGEVLTPKTEAYFAWKHFKNPFGESKVLLAKEEDKIIGLRAFMHWRWLSAEGTVSAVRAVDTATDPAHQGKGIFRKLTMQAVDECRQEGVDMVFNSPNPISMQGYLKMGWSQAGRLPVFIGPGSLLPRIHADKAIEQCYLDYPVDKAIQPIKETLSLHMHKGDYYTPIDYAYLDWRYNQCPVAKYGALIEPGEFGFIFRLKKMNRFIELRICEAWTETGYTGTKPAMKAFRKLVRHIRPALVSAASSPLFLTGKKQLPGFYGPFKKGPVITTRPLAMTDLSQFNQFVHWQPSLGSMELF
jgi:GNAT superfamily N-acetyltransferase